MAVASYVHVYEEGITENYTAKTDSNITVVSSTDSTKQFTLMGTTTLDNKKYAKFMSSNVSSVIISTVDAFEGITVELPMVSDTYEIYVDLKKKDLYAWTVESGAIVNDGTNDITTFYTDTLTPVLNTSTGAFSHLYNNLGEYYGGEVSSDLMSWTLTNTGGKTMGETYVNSMDNSVIQLRAIGPA